MVEKFAAMLQGGHPNSLGRTEEVVGIVLADPCSSRRAFQDHERHRRGVRLRVGDALEKVGREKPGWFVAHVDRLLGDRGRMEQPSVRWQPVNDRLPDPGRPLVRTALERC